MFRNFLLVGLGGFLGSMLRYAVYCFSRWENFPLATLIVNATGSFIIGIVIGLGIKDAAFSQSWKLFLATGICGGFTTFSAFSAENLHMLQSGKYTQALFYIITSIVSGILAAWLGFRLAGN